MRTLFLALALAAIASAQNITGSITGKVMDTAGAVVPDVAMTLTSVSTNISAAARTNSEGIFAFPLTKPGRYKLTAEKTGFQKYATEVFDVAVDQTVRLAPGLKLGAATSAGTCLNRPTLAASETCSLAPGPPTAQHGAIPTH